MIRLMIPLMIPPIILDPFVSLIRSDFSRSDVANTNET